MADFVRSELKFIQIFADDNPNFKMAKLTPDDVTFPLEKPIDGEKRLRDVDGLYPCLLVHVGSNGGIFLVS